MIHHGTVTRPSRPTWDEYFIGIAHNVARRSSCTRRQVGAVLVDRNRHIVGTGYNGSAPGALHCDDGHCPRGRLTHAELPPYAGDYGSCIAVHAESNALAQASAKGVRGATLYVTAEPCSDCWSLIRAYGGRLRVVTA